MIDEIDSLDDLVTGIELPEEEIAHLEQKERQDILGQMVERTIGQYLAARVFSFEKSDEESVDLSVKIREPEPDEEATHVFEFQE